ncbi:MAG: bifunctional metallophosphatase/5'-nucleotidase [Erysipelotrichaceae bacterium]|nr:bifunctional metallophosphatase/5'-nucleotidase [Erysipelotrichaceae bacterium]
MKILFKYLLVVLMCLSISSCKIKKQLKDDIYIFYTSDVHCGVNDNMTMPALKAMIEDTKAEHPYVGLVDTGDYVQGGSLGSLSKGEIIIEVMNEMGYDAVTFGNHEFDYGMPQLAKLVSMMNFQPTICNMIYEGDGENLFKDIPEYVMKDFDGTKVAFIGFVTPRTITSSTPIYFEEDGKVVYDFYYDEDGSALAARVQSVVDEVRKQGADYVVALSHLGTKEEEVPFDAVNLIRHTSGIDVVLDGHSHVQIISNVYQNKEGKDVVLSSAGTKMEVVGELIIGKDGSITTMLISEYAKKDKALEDVIAKAVAEQDEILKQEIFTIDHDLWATDEEGIRMTRSRETTAANFVSDAYRMIMGTQIGFANGGGVRTSVPAGVVTYQNLMDLNPFQNELSACKATGQQILDALEFGCQKTEKLYKLDGTMVGESGMFLCPSGLKYTIDTSVESAVIIDNEGMFAGFSSDDRRVKDVYVLVDGEYQPIDPNATYTVASSDYVLYNGGDGMTIFSDCEAIVKAGTTDLNALIDYAQSIKDFSNLYTDVEGRIVVE